MIDHDVAFTDEAGIINRTSQGAGNTLEALTNQPPFTEVSIMAENTIQNTPKECNEEWRPAPSGFGLYEVSNMGRCRRTTRTRGRPAGMILKNYINHHGYVVWNFSIMTRLVYTRAHREVALAFVGPRPSCKRQIRHLDGSKTNNNASNLIWGTHKENSEDSVRHGVIVRGSNQPSSKLHERHIARIIEMRRTGYYLRDIAQEFDVCQQTICSVCRNQTWKHVPRPEGAME